MTENPTSDLQIAADLRAAADYLRTHGHAKGIFLDRTGSACLLGAFGQAAGFTRLYQIAQPSDNWPPIQAMGFTSLADAVGWNDASDRTATEVIDRPESAALGLEIRALSDTVESLAAERLELVR